ncbi:hypothetical protein L195_g051936 [Trifolium pratense]|uniref:Uncharacterized protein n=1 Tax=Trifolium pratense TaxID=57577 RepID=A0A2K3K2C5_TRIPR|nr:hypothetical protein L195_g051936 [Trifolium pratense]
MAKIVVTEGVRSPLLLTERGESESEATKRTKWSSSDKRYQDCSWRKGIGLRCDSGGDISDLRRWKLSVTM